MKRIISLFSLFILLFVNIVTPVTYAMDGEDSSSESVSESTESSVDTDNSVGGGDDSSDTDASDDVASDEGTEPDADSESAEDTDADVTDEESSDEEGSDSTEGEELEESLENSASGSTDGDTSEEEVSAEKEIELLCKQEGAPENAHYLSSDEDASDVSCKWECDSHYALSEDGLSCVLVEESSESVVTDSKGNSEEVKSCEIPENAQKIENSNLTGEKCEWECSQGYLITKAGDSCEEINFSKYKNEPSVDALCYKLGLSWVEEKGDLAKLAGIDEYVGSREQNESIRVYLVDHVEDILKGKFNIQEEVVEKNKGYVYTNDVVLNTEEIKGESTYNNITVNVEAPIGSFPEGTTLKIKPIIKKKELKEIEDQIVTQQDNVDETLELLAFDISFFYDEKEVQPVEGETVQVTFDYAENKKLSKADTNEEQELKVYHLDDKDANGNKVEEIKVDEVNLVKNEEGTVAVDAEKFSVYVLTLVNSFEESGNISLILNLGDGNLVADGSNFTCENTTCKILVKSGDVKLPGAELAGKNFLGWYEYAPIYGDAATRLGGAGDIINISSSKILNAIFGDVAVVWGNTGYNSLEAAINAIPTNGESYSKIVILKDITLTNTVTISNGKKVELDLNGYTISKDAKLISVDGGSLNIVGSGMLQETQDDQLAPILIYGSTDENAQNYSNVTIGKDVTLRGWAGVHFGDKNYVSYGVNLDFYGHAICPTPQDGTMTAGNCINFNGKIKNTTNVPNIIIREGATIESSLNGGVGIYAAGYGKWTIEDGATIIGNDSAIEIRAGELTINGGTFTANANNCPASVVYNGNGSTTVGAALAIAQHDTKLPLTVNIDGGEFVGCAAISQSNPQNNTQEDAQNVKTKVHGGVFSGEVGNAFTGSELTIMGGTFTSDPTNYKAEGHVVSSNDGSYTVSYDPIAEVYSGETLIGGFSSLEKAFEEANRKDEAVIVLKKKHNVELPNRRLIAKGNIIFDLNNQILEINGNNSACHISPLSGYITVDGGKLTIKQGTIDDKTSNQCFTHTIRVDNDAILNLENLTLKGDRSRIYNNDTNVYIALVRVDKGTLNIDSSEIISTKNFNVEVLQTSKITIKGNSNFKSNNPIYTGAINMNGSSCKAEITGGIINVNSENKNLKLFNDGENKVRITGGTFNQDPSKWVADGYLVVAKEGSYDVVANNSLEEIDGNYMANPETSVSGEGIDANSTLKNLTVEVKENGGTGATITADILSGSDNSTLLGQVVLTFKKGNDVIENVKLGHTILVRIPVSGDFENVVILADHGNGFGTVGLATADRTCTAEGEASNNQYTGGLIPVQNGYASIYTCQASIFDAVGTYYNATLISDGADSEGTQKIYYAYGTYRYYTDDNDESSILSGKAIDTPSKNGYEFIGYFSGNTKVISETGLIIDSEFNVAANNTYIAKYNKGLHAFSYAEISSGTYNNGSSIAGNKNYNDEIVLKAPINMDSDYEFNGWSLYSGAVAEENDVTTIINPTCNTNNAKCTFNMPNYDVVAKAKIEKKEYTITFDSNGGTEVAAQTGIAYGHTGTLPANPIYSGFGFIGWTLNGESFDIETTPITGNITLVADWKANNENIFYTKGGTGFWIVLYDDGNIDYVTTKSKNGMSSNAEFVDFIFGSGTASHLQTQQIAGLLATAQAEIVSIPDLGGAVLFLNYASGSTYPTKGFCSNSGCDYFASKNWTGSGRLPSMDTGSALGPTWMNGATNYGKYMEIEGSGYVVHASTGNHNGYIYVPYKSFTVDYSYQGAPYWAEGLPTSGTYKYKDIVDVASLPTAQGYTFTGWFLDGELTGSFSMPAKDVVLTGEFLGNDSDYGYHYELETLEGNWVTTGSKKPLNGKEGDIFNFPSSGLPTFEGFSLTGDYSGLVIRSGFDLPIKYERNSYTVNYAYENNVPGSSALPASGTYKYEASVPVAPLATASGYDFEWSGYTAGGSFNMPANDVTITGKFIPRNDTKYLVRYYFENEVKTGWVIDNTKTQTFTGITEKTASVTAPEFPGFTYNESKSSPSKVIEGSGATVLRLYYDRNEIKINFVDGSGTIAEEVYTGNYNTSLKKGFPAWIKTGYTLSWSESLPTKFPAEDMTITASWSANDIDYRIYNHIERITNNGYTARKDSSYKDGSGKVATVIEVPMELTGLTLNTGYKNAAPCEVDGDVCKITIPDNATSGMKIDVYYKRNPITITFDSDGGSDVKSITKKYEYTLSGEIPVAPTKTGYVFSGWLLPNNEVVANLNGYQLTEDVTLTGVWKESDETLYHVEHYLENLDGIGFDLKETEEFSGTTNSTVYATGLYFAGFTYNSGYSENVLSGTITASGDLVLKLFYNRNSYNVSYELSGDLPDTEVLGMPFSGDFKYGETVKVKNGATATGYNFSGWFLDGELTGEFVMPDNDIILTGEFSATDVNYSFHYEIEDLSGNFVPTSDEARIRTGKAGSISTSPKEESLYKYITNSYPGFSLSGYIDDYREVIRGDGSTDIAIQLKRNQYNVEYAYEKAVTGASALPEKTGYKYEAPVRIAPLATASGYDFKWSGYGENDSFPMPANNVVITGVFTPRNDTPYTVAYYYQRNDGKYYLSGSKVRTGTTEDTGYVEDEDKISQDTENYVFTESGSVLTGTISGDGKLVLKVLFKGIYTVKYLPGDDQLKWSYTKTGLEYGATTPIFPYNMDWLEKPYGYVFDKWTPVIQQNVTGNIEYIAQWAPKETKYTVEYYQENLSGDDYKLIDSESLTGKTRELVTGDVINYPGFTYSGDISNQTGEVEGDGSLVLKLYYTRNSHTYTYSDPNGNPVEKIVKYGEDISTETEEYEGYELSGYTTDVPTSMPDSNLNVTPIWNLKQYKVSFDTNGGDPIEKQTYTIESGINSLPTPVRTGYEFTGWYDGDTKVTAIATGSTGDVSLTAHWEAAVANYTVKHYREAWKGFNKNGKTASQASDGKWYYEYISQPFTGLVNNNTGPVTPNKYDGFIYDESAPNITSGTITTEGLELKLYYARKLFTVSFDSNGGSAVTGQEVGYALTGTQPANPVRTGYQFVGWNDKDGNPYDFENNDVRKNIKLTAEWTPNNYLVNFDSNGASGNIGSIATQYDTEITLSTGSELSKTGHNFMGWSTTSTGDVEYAGGEVVSGLVDTGSITLYAIWTPKKYDITFVDEDGTTVLGVFSGAYGEDPASFWKEDPTQSSANWKCQFKGWSPTPAAITGEATYKATFYSLDDNNPDLCSLASYTVTWKNDDGTEIKSDGHIGFGSTPSYSGAVPQKTGDEQYSYIFSGWTPAITKVTGDVEYTAEYTAVLNKYDVTWNNWDGTEIKVDTGIDYGTTLEFSGEVPQRTGDNIYSYVFSGWTPSVHAITGDTVYQAEFKSTFTPYTITWSGNNDNNLTNIEVLQVWHSYVKVQPNPERTGYVFSGWTPEVISGTSIVEGDQTYLAQWTPATGIEYKVKHYLQELDGSYPENPKDTDTLSGTTEKLTNAVEKSYSGFSLSGNIKQQQIKADGSTVVSVYYKRDSYKIEFSSDGGTTVAEQTVLYEKSGSKPEDPKKTGYTFSGWTMNGIPYDFTAPVTGNITLTGTWTPNVYTVKFDANKGTGTAIDDMDFTYDVAQNLPDSTFTRKYYSFSGWNTEADGSGSGYNSGESVSNLTAISGDVVTLYAQWLGKSYVVIFSGNGATSGEMEDQEFEFGKTEPLNENKFEKEGYHFIGWKTDPTTGKLYKDKISYPTWTKKDSITLYAQWQINHPSIIFDTVGGTEIDSISGDYNTPITATTIPTPTRTGYVFGGWDKEIPTTMPAEDMTITAKWLSTEWSIDEKVSPHGEGENGKGYDTEISGYDIKYTNVSLRIPNDDEDRGGKTATWLGFKLTAPEAVTAKNSGAAYLKTYSNTKYTIAQAADETDSDGRYVVYVWMPLTDEDVKSAISGEKTEIEYTTIVSWDGNEESEKTIKATVDLKSLLIEDKDGDTVLVQTDDEGNIIDKNEFYDVTFDSNGGTAVTGQNVRYNSGVVIPAEPTKTGYQFSGWTMDGTVFDFTGSKITGDIILTGVWTPITYKINYVVNGGENKSGNATTYTIEDTVPLYNTAIRTGYVFKGWLDADLGIVKQIKKGTTGERNLLAQWQQVDAALAEAKSGDKHPVVSSDVTVDVDAAPGTAEYTGNIPTGTLSFDTPLLTNVVNSGTIEEYSLVGIKRASTQLDVKTDELQVKTGYVATIVGGLEVYLKKITITKNASGVIETKTEKNTNTVNFSKPVALPINITTSATGVKVMVNHGEGYGLSGLSINPNTTCTNGIASDPYTGELIPVENSYAWIYTCSASTFVAYTEAPKSNGGGSSSGGSGGGGGGSSKSSSSSSSSSTTPTTNTGNTTNIDLKGVVSAPNKACLNITEESKIKYSDEVLDAYAWAYANGVVTSNDVEKARVYSYITRAELAKIMVQYVAGVLKKKPVVEGNVSYADVDESLGEYAGYINLAYQYQIMGINADGTPLKEFGPKSLVTRAEFASVLSRVLYGDKYNVDGSAFYSMHIDVLNQLGIIKDSNPAILEKIGWILIMLKRASKDIPNTKDVSNVEYCPITAEDEQKAAYEWALKYGITSIDDPDKARLGEELTRAEFAKMMVQYMINVLHKKPILNKDISYPDVDGSLGDLEAYIKLAYQYQIMGIHGNGQPLEEFAPNRIVTRKEFATVFSRILFGDRFNIDGPEYWTNHIDALKEISVLKDGNPALQEVRGRVMLMMYRSADDLNK